MAHLIASPLFFPLLSFPTLIIIPCASALIPAGFGSPHFLPRALFVKDASFKVIPLHSAPFFFMH